MDWLQGIKIIKSALQLANADFKCNFYIQHHPERESNPSKFPNNSIS
jgi:hypothetical protein